MFAGVALIHLYDSEVVILVVKLVWVMSRHLGAVKEPVGACSREYGLLQN